AALLALAQGFIVRGARGVTAWDVPAMPLVFLGSALVSGTGLFLVVEVAAGRAPGRAALGGTLAVLALGALAWLAYLTASRDAAFARAIRPLRRATAAVAVAGGGHLLPFALATAALVTDEPAAALGAGVLMVSAQLYVKWLLVLAVGALRPVTLANLRLPRRLS
ncbi:MAG TPA: hypothetical protein VFX28_10765, partial [Methylomirabilota bacterium]|nr:hypothetical protein [Methylomirabilota bacterium]